MDWKEFLKPNWKHWGIMGFLIGVAVSTYFIFMDWTRVSPDILSRLIIFSIDAMSYVLFFTLLGSVIGYSRQPLNSMKLKEFLKPNWKHWGIMGFLIGVIVPAQFIFSNLNEMADFALDKLYYVIIVLSPSILFFTLFGSALAYSMQTTVYWKKYACIGFVSAAVLNILVIPTLLKSADPSSDPIYIIFFIGVVLLLLPVLTIIGAFVGYLIGKFKNKQ